MPNQYTVLSNESYIDLSKKRLINSCDINNFGCWIWKGYLCGPKNIYGLTSSRLDGKRKKILSHRLSYRLWKGEIPHNLFVLHSCDTPLCINPDHLHVGDAQSNMDEMKERGRKKPAKGIRNRHAKLTEKEVLEIRQWHKDGISVSSISRIKKMSSSTISYITRKITWGHI